MSLYSPALCHHLALGGGYSPLWGRPRPVYRTPARSWPGHTCGGETRAQYIRGAATRIRTELPQGLLRERAHEKFEEVGTNWSSRRFCGARCSAVQSRSEAQDTTKTS